jgi:hypothetical protein
MALTIPNHPPRSDGIRKLTSRDEYLFAFDIDCYQKPQRVIASLTAPDAPAAPFGR